MRTATEHFTQTSHHTFNFVLIKNKASISANYPDICSKLTVLVHIEHSQSSILDCSFIFDLPQSNKPMTTDHRLLRQLDKYIMVRVHMSLSKSGELVQRNLHLSTDVKNHGLVCCRQKCECISKPLDYNNNFNNCRKNFLG